MLFLLSVSKRAKLCFLILAVVVREKDNVNGREKRDIMSDMTIIMWFIVFVCLILLNYVIDSTVKIMKLKIIYIYYKVNSKIEIT